MFHVSSLLSPRRRRHSSASVRLGRVAKAPQTSLSDTTSTRAVRAGRLRRAFSVGSAMEPPRSTKLTRAQTWPHTRVAPAPAPAPAELAPPWPRWGHPAARTLLRLRIMVKTGAPAEAIFAELRHCVHTLGATRPADAVKALLRLEGELPNDASLLRPGSNVGKAFACLVAEAIFAELHRYVHALGATRPAEAAMALLRLDRELPDDASLLRPGSKVGKAFACLVRELQLSGDQTSAVTDNVFKMVIRRVANATSVLPTMISVRPVPRMVNPPVVVF